VEVATVADSQMKPSVAFEIPIGVREAAIFLGVSIQAVYL
jgi:hypothetical protein